MKTILVMVLLVSTLLACRKFLPSAPADDQVLDGPLEELTPGERSLFLQGDIAFNDEIFTETTGLGPIFVATSCGTCHAADGKGHPFTTLTRFGQIDSTGNSFLQMGGPQLQHRAIPGREPEQIPAGVAFSKFTPPANTGLGFIDFVTDAAILALADEKDLDGDGISGRPNWIRIPDYTALRSNGIEWNEKYIGRFGKKAAVYDLLQQTANAYNQDMGISSNYEYVDTYNGQNVDPEISNQSVLAVVFYLRTLKAPVQRDQNDKDVIAGKQLFLDIGCGNCHQPQLQTGPSNIAGLNNKTFFPYTDLLLHDMGAGLDDGYTEGSATTSEWRTPPLWGLGLSENSQGGQVFLLHDGRAKSIQEAILLHGGEGLASKTAFQQLSSDQESQLLKFLKSL